MSLSTMKDTLNQIRLSSRDFLKRHPSLFNSANNFAPYSCPELSVPDCALPKPQPLRLGSDLGLDLGSTERISMAYLRAAIQLKADYEQQFRRVCHDIAQIRSPLCPDTTRLQSALLSTYVSEYTERLNVWVEEVKHRILRAKQRQGTTSTPGHSRRSFSQQAISVLVKFFEHNAFPSRSEKHHLAAETNMKYSQVHIWFQNRRRRFRKEGKEFKKPDPVSVLPSELETSVVELLASTEPNIYSGGRSVDSADADVLDPPAPQHAFPCSYPPVCDYEPFPVEIGMRKFTTPWIRLPSSSTFSGRSIDIDVAQLTESFVKMTLVNEPRIFASPVSSQSPLPSPNRLSDVLCFTTIAPRAPHPAFIYTAVTRPSIPCAKTSVLSNDLDAGRTSVLCSPPTASVTQTKKPISRRKVAPLPKRLPTRASIVHQGVPPAVSPFATPSHISRSSPATSTISSDSIASSASHPYIRTMPLPKVDVPQVPSGRKVTALPKRTTTRPTVSYNHLSSPPRFTSKSSRTLSTSSSASSGSSSPSESDTPLITPPSSPFLLASKTSAPCTPGSTSFSSPFEEPSIGTSTATEGLQLHLEKIRIVPYVS